MKSLKVIAKITLLSFLMMMFSAATFAESSNREKSILQIQGTGVAILGNGGSLGVHIAEWIYVGGESFAAKITGEREDENDNTKKYPYEFSFQTMMALIRLSPISSSSFYLQAATVYRDWHYEETGQIEHDVLPTVTGKAEVDWPNTGVQYGLGFNWIADFGLSGGFGLGVITGGAPKVKFTMDDPTLQAQYQDEIDEEEDRVNEDLEQYKTIPYIALHLGFTF